MKRFFATSLIVDNDSRHNVPAGRYYANTEEDYGYLVDEVNGAITKVGKLPVPHMVHTNRQLVVDSAVAIVDNTKYEYHSPTIYKRGV